MPSQRPVHDITCSVKGGILCMLDELKIVQTVADGIARKSMEIEKHIQQKQTNALKILNKNVENDINFTRVNLPKSTYHKNFSLENNINQEYLTKLILEGHSAMIFFFNTINDLLSLQDLFSEQTDKWFKIIQNNIEDDIICRYRSVINVFYQKWKPMNQISRMHFSKKSNLPPSLIHDVHSLVITNYLKQWMVQIDEMIEDLPSKYS